MFVGIYKPPSLNIQYFLNTLSDLLDFYSNHYDNKVILGDFNLYLVTFLNERDLIYFIRNNTCFKGEGSCIHLILTNRKYSFKNSTFYETGLSDHHHLIYSMLKTTFHKEEPKTLIYIVIITRSLWKHSVLNDFQILNHKRTMNTTNLKKKKKFADTLNKQAPEK